MKDIGLETIRNINTNRFSEIKLGYADDDITVVNKLNIPINSIKLDFIVMVVCMGGNLRLDISNQTYTICPNNILICTPNLTINNYMITPNFNGKILCLSRKLIHEIFRNASDIWEKTFYIKENPIISMDERDARDAKGPFLVANSICSDGQERPFTDGLPGRSPRNSTKATKEEGFPWWPWCFFSW